MNIFCQNLDSIWQKAICRRPCTFHLAIFTEFLYLAYFIQGSGFFWTPCRKGVWECYCYTKAKLLPFLFLSNRTVYSRFMPFMELQSSRLPTDLLESFKEGNFVAKLTNGSFNSVWYDYILEVTENKSLKTSGGIIGLTHNDSALFRWFLARPLTAKYALAYSAPKQATSKTHHHTDTPYHIQAYNETVQNMLHLFESETFIDPFSLDCPPSRLVNIANGEEIPAEIEKSLLECHELGKQSLGAFVEERFVVADGETTKKNFFDPLSKSKVKTTSSKSGSRSNSSKPIDGEEMYLRLLAINAFKKVPIDRVISFENAHVPLSLFNDDGLFMATKNLTSLISLKVLLVQMITQ